jgi:hypothetical protein
LPPPARQQHRVAVQQIPPVYIDQLKRSW